MLKYWPMIEYKENGDTQKLSTSDPFNSAEQAVKQVDFWMKDYGFDISAAKVQVYNNGELLRTIRLQTVLDAWGNVKRWQLPTKAVLGTRAG